MQMRKTLQKNFTDQMNSKNWVRKKITTAADLHFSLFLSFSLVLIMRDE